MNRRTLLVLVAAAAIVVGWAIWLNGSSRHESDGERRALLIPSLAEGLDSIERLRITGPGAETLVTLARSESGWVVAERDDWPADVGQLRGFLVGLSQARKLEAKTALSRNYSQLGVEDVSEPAGKGVRLDLDWPDASTSLIIGLNNPNGRGSFVRTPGQAQSWLTDTDLAVERNPARWLSRSLLSVAESELASLSLEQPDGKTLQLSRSEASDQDVWMLQPLPDGRQANQTALAGAAGFLDGLRLEDVKRAEPPEDAPERVATFIRRDGVRIALRLWPDDAGQTQSGAMPWAAIDVDFDESRAQEYHTLEWRKDQRALAAAEEPAPGAESADEVSDQPERPEAAGDTASAAGTPDRSGDTDDVPADRAAAADGTDAVSPSSLDVAARVAASRAEAQALDARLDGWLFKLPAFKLANLRRESQDFLTPES